MIVSPIHPKLRSHRVLAVRVGGYPKSPYHEAFESLHAPCKTPCWGYQQVMLHSLHLEVLREARSPSVEKTELDPFLKVSPTTS